MARIEKIRGRYIQRSFNGIDWHNEAVREKDFIDKLFGELGWDGLVCTDSENGSVYSLYYRLEPKGTKYELELTGSELEELPDWVKERLNAQA